MAEIKEMECLLDQLTTSSSNPPTSALQPQVTIAAETSDFSYDPDFQSLFHDNSLSTAMGRDEKPKEEQDGTNFEKTFTTKQTEDEKMQQIPDLSSFLKSESEKNCLRTTENLQQE